eukprot:6790797-Prymnesium_polylepis.3
MHIGLSKHGHLLRPAPDDAIQILQVPIWLVQHERAPLREEALALVGANEPRAEGLVGEEPTVSEHHKNHCVVEQ